MLSCAHRDRSMSLVVTETGSSCAKEDLERAVEHHERPVYMVRGGPAREPSLTLDPPADGGSPVEFLPGIRPEHLGDSSFLACHRVRFPYICGEMANGIATVEMVAEAARAGWLGFFGAAGCTLDRIERAMARLGSECAEASWGSNLIHSPNEPQLEEKTVDIYLRHGVRRVSASAFMAMRPSIVKYACSGLTEASRRFGDPAQLCFRQDLAAGGGETLSISASGADAAGAARKQGHHARGSCAWPGACPLRKTSLWKRIRGAIPTTVP